MKKQKGLTKILKSLVPSTLFGMFMEERKNTGRIYLMNVDNANDLVPFPVDKAPVRQSNLCCEINLSTKPLSSFDDPEGEIALCTLSVINWGKIQDPRDFEKPCTLAVRGLDALLDYPNYRKSGREFYKEKTSIRYWYY